MGGSEQWHSQTDLGDNRRLIQLDLPGFGRNSDMQPIDRIEGFAAWVLDTLTELGCDRFDLLGHSMGGMIVQEMVRLAPEHVSRLILYGTGAAGVLPGRFETIETSIERARSDGPRATARRIAATWFRDGEHSDEYPACANIAERSSLAAILSGLTAMRNWSGVEHLGRIQSSTLVLWGDCDRTYSWPQTQRLWDSIPDSHLAVVPGCAHAVHLEQPALFNRLVTHFLEM